MVDKKAPPSAEFGEDAPADEKVQTIAEKNLEIERLRRELATLQATVDLNAQVGVVYLGDPNETYMGVGRIEADKFVADAEGKPVYRFQIDLPPSGGQDIKLCGVPFYHGVGYMVYVDQLRSLREIVARSWAHEATIRGSNENFYRKETAPIFSGTRGRLR